MHDITREVVPEDIYNADETESASLWENLVLVRE